MFALEFKLNPMSKPLLDELRRVLNEEYKWDNAFYIATLQPEKPKWSTIATATVARDEGDYLTLYSFRYYDSIGWQETDSISFFKDMVDIRYTAPGDDT